MITLELANKYYLSTKSATPEEESDSYLESWPPVPQENQDPVTDPEAEEEEKEEEEEEEKEGNVGRSESEVSLSIKVC